MEHTDAYMLARKRVESKLGFYRHVVVYVVVCTVLVLINLRASPGYLWSLWPVGGWGLGLLLHAVQVFWYGRPSVSEHLVERELAKEA
ncbi:MAG: 2TM domain-containing protein [Bacteroidota bacterium]